ncbi:glycerol acyltransferase [Sandaracinomonas limnophila]|uniref:Glycerol acyltransferase n=1 Tax=Sandaracinomonas limnophila TaxID=1862386 RepID=A0A437PX25_9BACT|nr:1-acyl-sn-glycerol-3-phosphate acyltransferase [Sandaracinomonas limnophila]RVU26768.1 glycerol acyltransferase [Sandaracinomonas limnophila]
MSNWLFDWLFKLSGWKVSGNIPYHLKKCIIIVCPHATWVDFPVGVGVRSILKRKIYFWGKKELFQGPFGWIFKKLGGYPVDRTKHTNLVDAIAEIYNSKDEFYAGLAPEGTRKDVKELKSGFYYIAQKANIPIVMVGFDFVNKKVMLNEPYYPSGDFEKDKIDIAKFYQTVPGIQKSWIKNYLKNS